MPLGNPQGGFSNLGEFQSSALPWVTSSLATSTPTQINFNYITRFITVINPDANTNLSMGFTLNGISNGQRVIIPHGTSLTFDWRATKIWIKSETGSSLNYSLAVGLTTVPASMMPLLTGSAPNGTDWAGVG